MSEVIGKVDRNLIEDAHIPSRYQREALMTLTKSLEEPDRGPLLTIDEYDLAIDSEVLYFGAVTRRFTPRNATELVRSGELSDDEIQRKQQIGRAVVRGQKTDMYVDRIMTATYSTDVCRSYLRYLKSGEVIEVDGVTGSESAFVWTKDYAEELFRAAREERVLSGAAMKSTVGKILERFTPGRDDIPYGIWLTTLTGMNQRKKIDFWLGQLHSTSKGFERINNASRDNLYEFIANRPSEFFKDPDLNKLIADRANGE